MLLSIPEIELALNREHVRVTLSDYAPEGPQVIRIRKNFGTACWSWTPPHSIYIGDGILKNPHVMPGLSKKEQAEYFQSFYRHEVGHARFTEKDLKAVSEDLKKLKCPFSLLNLFEDARIEHLMRADFGPFNWLKFEKPEKKIRTSSNIAATTIFFAIIQAEGDEQLVEESIKLHVDYLEVLEFYQRALEVASTKELYPMLVEWIQRFGVPPEDKNSDLAQGAAIQADPSLKEKIDADAYKGQTPQDDDSADPSIAPNLTEMQEASKVAEALYPLFKKKVGRVGSQTPARARFSARHEIVGRAPFRKKEVLSKARKTVELFIDCSGSMEGTPIHNARILGAALSLLAESGHVKGNATLCGVFPLRTYSLPLTASQLKSIQAVSPVEGLEPALKQRLKSCTDADLVLLFTDGRITDVPINKANLHARGIYTWGLYVGDYTDTSELFRYFDKVACRSSIAGLVDAIISQI